MQQKITPNFWFDGNAKEAVNFYMETFEGCRIINTSYYPSAGLMDFQNNLAGKELAIDFEVAGYQFTAINAGSEFKSNPSISFILNFNPSRDEHAKENLEALWAKLIDGGQALMQLNEYAFSERYGWVKDRFGITWQLILTDPLGEPRPLVVPSLMFSGINNNRAEEAMNFYQTVFQDSADGAMMRYEQAAGAAEEGAILSADFTIANQWFTVMDSSIEQNFTFNEAISLSISCNDQQEIDYFWNKLSYFPQAERCGWCKDQFGMSWQIVPANMSELLKKPDAFRNMMKMKKLVIADF